MAGPGTTITITLQAITDQAGAQIKGVLDQLNASASKINSAFGAGAARPIKETESALMGMMGAVRGLAGAFGIVLGIEGLKGLIEGSIEARKEMAKLDEALRSSGQSSEEYKKRLKDQRVSLGESTNAHDAELAAVQRILIQFHLKEEDLKRLVPLTLDYAAAMGTDAASAAMALGRALQTGEISLRGMHLIIPDTLTATERMQFLFDTLTQSVGDQAVALARAGGEWDKLGHEMSKVKRNAGDFLSAGGGNWFAGILAKSAAGWARMLNIHPDRPEVDSAAAADAAISIAAAPPRATTPPATAFQRGALDKQAGLLDARRRAEVAQAGLPAIVAQVSADQTRLEEQYKLGEVSFDDYLTKRRQLAEKEAKAEENALSLALKSANAEMVRAAQRLREEQDKGPANIGAIKLAQENYNKAVADEAKLTAALTAAKTHLLETLVGLSAQRREEQRALETARPELEVAKAQGEQAEVNATIYFDAAARAEDMIAALELERAAVESLVKIYEERARVTPDEKKRLEYEQELVRLRRQLVDLGARETQETSLGKATKGIADFHAAATNLTDNSVALGLRTMESAVNGVSASIVAAMSHTKNWGQAFWGAMRQAIQGIVEMAAQYIAAKAAMAAVDAAFHAKSMAEASQKAGASGVAGMAKAGEEGGWVGVLIYMGVFLAAMAAIMAIAAGLSGGFAAGGRPPTGRPALVGEEGPELFVPDSAGTVIPAQLTAELLANPVPRRELALGHSSSAPTVNHRTEVTLAQFGGEADAHRWARSQSGEVWFNDMLRKNIQKYQR